MRKRDEERIKKEEKGKKESRVESENTNLQVFQINKYPRSTTWF